MRSRMRSCALRLFLLSSFCQTLAVSPVSAQNSEQEAMAGLMRWFAERCPSYLAEVSREFGEMLEGTERDLFRSIKVKCVDDAGFGAASSIDATGDRLIQVTYGTLMALEPIATISAIGSQFDAPLCAPLYLDHYGKVFRHNMASLERGGTLRSLTSPFEFLRNEEECPKLSQEQAMSSSEVSDLRELTINAGLKFILAHEFAHHLLVSTPRSDPEMEQRCDRFAIEYLARSGVGPFGAALPVSILGAFDDFSVRKSRGTHPAGGCRFLTLAAALEDLLQDDDDFRRYYEAQRPGMIAMFRRSIDAMKRMAEEEGGC